MRLDLKSYFLRKIMISTSASQTRTRLISSLFSQFRDDGVSILFALGTVSLMLLLVGKHWTDMVVSNFPLFCFSIFNIRFWAMRSSPGTGAGAPSTGLCVLWKDTINKFCRNHQNHQDFSNFWVLLHAFPISWMIPVLHILILHRDSKHTATQEWILWSGSNQGGLQSQFLVVGWWIAWGWCQSHLP